MEVFLNQVRAISREVLLGLRQGRLLKTDAGITLILCGCLTGAMVFLFFASCYHSGFTFFTTQYFRWYVLVFWKANIILLLCASLIISAFAIGIPSKILFLFYENSEEPYPGDRQWRKVAGTLSYLFAAATGFVMLITLPALHLHVPSYLQGLNLVFITLLGVIQLLPTRAQSGVSVRLSKLSFPRGYFCDCAAMATTPLESEAEIAEYYRVKDESAHGIDEYLSRGIGYCQWKGLETFYKHSAQIVGLNSPERMTTHENTTQAFYYSLIALLRDQSGTSVVYCDNNYPSINRVIELAVSPNSAHRVVTSPNEVSDVVTQRIADAVVGATTDKVIVVATHVSNRTGTILNVAKLRDTLDRITGKSAALIVDGAQAVGNIDVSEDCCNACTIYVFSGHKWLLGRNSLGLCVHNPERLSTFGVDAEAFVKGINRPFSHVSYNAAEDVTRETISLEPIISLSAVLPDILLASTAKIAEHNRRLAAEFGRIIGPQGLMLVAGPSNGIVCVKVEAARDICRRLRKSHDVHCSVIDDNTLRFCFHYYMSVADVSNVVRCLTESIEAARLGRQVA